MEETTGNPEVTASMLAEKGMIVRLATSSWSGRLTDKVVTQEVLDGKNAQKDSGSFSKAIINKDALKSIREALKSMKDFHNEQTLPWDKNGGRILPTTQYEAYTLQVRESSRLLEEAVELFVASYASYIGEAEERLGDLFSEDDYPAISEIKEKFSLSVSFEKVPEAADFRVDISDSEQQRLREQITSRVGDQYNDSIKRIWNRIYTAVERMNERLSSVDNVFRDTLVENVQQLAEVLPSLNIMEDPALAQMATELQNKLCGYTPAELRQNHVLRSEVSDSSRELMNRMGAMGGIFTDRAEAAARETEAEADDEVESLGDIDADHVIGDAVTEQAEAA